VKPYESLNQVSAHSRMRPWIDDVPQGALERPARYVTGEIRLGPDTPVRRERMVTETANASVEAGMRKIPESDWVPVSRSARERADGVYVEARRVKGKTIYRPVRTCDMDDETPLPSIAYRTSKVLR
jgi:hypothetical protein